jgi:hypothetical protein
VVNVSDDAEVTNQLRFGLGWFEPGSSAWRQRVPLLVLA